MSDNRAELLARLGAEQREHWRAGQRILVEEFLARYPALEADEAGLVDLIVGEIQLRQRLGETPSHDEYLRRFPHYHTQLASYFAPRARHSPTTMAPDHPPTHSPPAAAARPSPSISDVAILASMPPSEEGGSSGDTGTEGVRRTQTMEGGSNPLESTGLRQALGDAAQDSRPAGAGAPAATVSGVARVAPAAPRRFPNPPGYVILAELGKGGMGVVYKAWETHLRREVALKVALVRPLGGGTGATELGRFRKEAEAMARLHHPNIVQVYHVGEHEGVPYFALEYVEGQSLDQKLRGETQTAPEAARIVQTLALAIDHAHRMGVVHRDLKPANVLLAKDGTPKITDFGLAKRLDEVSTTKSGELMGTPCYMAPEQAAGKAREVGPPADVYALGAILYECLTGKPPFKEATTPLTILAVLHTEPVPPRRVQPAVPRDLETICLKCLEKDPKKRYASAAMLAEDLDRFLDKRTILARRSTLPERTWKWARRRPAIAALAVLSLVTLLLGSTSVLYYLKSETTAAQRNAERREEELNRLKETEKVRDEVRTFLQKAKGHLAGKAWQGALAAAQTALSLIDQNPKLPEEEELRFEAQDLKEQAEEQMKRREQEEQARAAFDDSFKKHYDDALFFTSPSNGLPPDVSVARAGAKAREALAVFTDGAGTDGPAKSVKLNPLFSHLEKEKQSLVRERIYELLLVLAEAEARSAPAGPPIERNERLDRAVRLLDRAQSLRFQTVAWHERRADYLERLGAKQQAEQERKEADRLRAQLEQGGAGAQSERVVDLFLLGSTAYLRGQLERAVLLLERAVRLRPDHLWARHLLVLGYLQRGEPGRAETHLCTCLEQRRDFVWFYLDRAQAHGMLADLARRAQPPQPGRVQYHFERAQEDYEQAGSRVAGDDTARYVLHNNRGMLWFQQGEFKRAINELKQALAYGRDPDRSRTRDLLAEVYRGYKVIIDNRPTHPWLVDATAEANKAITLRPDQPDLYRRRALIQLERGKVKEALDDLNTAIRLRQASKPPAQAGAPSPAGRAENLAALLDDLTVLGRTLQDAGESARRAGAFATAVGEFSRAVDAFDKALAVADQLQQLLRQEQLPGVERLDLPEARLGRAFCLLRCAEHPPDPKKKQELLSEVIAAYDFALRSARVRMLPEAYHGRAEARLSRGRPEDLAGAVQDYTVALLLNESPRPAWLAQRGWLYLDRLGAAQLALADFEKVLELRSSDGDGHAGRALALARLSRDRVAATKDAEQALVLARKMAGQSGKSKEAARLFANVARAYVRLGDLDGAADSLAEAFGSLPDAKAKRQFWRDVVDHNVADFEPILRHPKVRRMNDER